MHPVCAGHLKGTVPPRELRAEIERAASDLRVESYNELSSGKSTLDVLMLFGWTQLPTWISALAVW